MSFSLSLTFNIWELYVASLLLFLFFCHHRRRRRCYFCYCVKYVLPYHSDCVRTIKLKDRSRLCVPVALNFQLRNYRVISAHAPKRRLWNDLWQRYEIKICTFISCISFFLIPRRLLMVVLQALSFKPLAVYRLLSLSFSV